MPWTASFLTRALIRSISFLANKPNSAMTTGDNTCTAVMASALNCSFIVLSCWCAHEVRKTRRRGDLLFEDIPARDASSHGRIDNVLDERLFFEALAARRS